jgi:hypothetical protein
MPLQDGQKHLENWLRDRVYRRRPSPSDSETSLSATPEDERPDSMPHPEEPPRSARTFSVIASNPSPSSDG